MLLKNNDRIVFAGDSVTDAGCAKPHGEGLGTALGNGYVNIIDNMLAAFYPDMSFRVTNSGVGGNTSRDLLERYDRDVVDLKPDWVSILIGVNDVWRQFDLPAFPDKQVLPDEYKANLTEMVERINGRVKGIFIISPFLIEASREDSMRKRVDEYAAIAREVSEKYNCRYIDLQTVFENYCKIKHSSYLSWDRVHPNKIGATLMAKEILKNLEFDFTR